MVKAAVCRFFPASPLRGDDAGGRCDPGHGSHSMDAAALTILAPSKRYHAARKYRHKKLTDYTTDHDMILGVYGGGRRATSRRDRRRFRGGGAVGRQTNPLPGPLTAMAGQQSILGEPLAISSAGLLCGNWCRRLCVQGDLAICERAYIPGVNVIT